MSSIKADYKYYKKFIKVTKKGVILDLGCGTGKISAYLTEQGYTCIGYDLNEKVIKKGRKQYPGINLNVGNISYIPKQNKKATGALYIYSLSSLSYNEIYDSFISCNKNLINNGKVLISVLCEGNKYNTNILNKNELKLLLYKTGFRIYYCKYRNKSKNVIHMIARKHKNM